jgi:hypothetical protein
LQPDSLVRDIIDKPLRRLNRERLAVPDARFSPDGRYGAFTTDQSGKPEVIVQHVSTKAIWSISTDPSRDGDAMGRNSFLASDDNLMAVPVDPDAKALRAGVPQPLFQTGLNTIPDGLRSFGVTPNGQCFLVSVPENPGTGPSLVVVSNWPAALKP